MKGWIAAGLFAIAGFLFIEVVKVLWYDDFKTKILQKK